MRYKIIDTLIDIRLNPDLEQIWHPFLTEDLSEKLKLIYPCIHSLVMGWMY